MTGIWPKERYLDSRGVLIRAKKIMIERGYTDAIFAAHQLHLSRVRLLARKLEIPEARKIKISNIPFPKDSPQWWTTNAELFLLREGPTYVHHFVKGWI